MVLALESQITLLSIDNTSTVTPPGSTSLNMPPPKLQATENTGVDCYPHNVASQPNPNLGMSMVTDAPETDADQVRVLI